MNLTELRPNPGAKHRKKVYGRGPGSGQGKTAGRGAKGQRARNTVPRGFEGGQTPLHRRLPRRRGFRNPFAREYAIINISQLNRFEENAVITPETLMETGIVRDLKDGLKILGDGELKVRLIVHAHKFSSAAIEKIQLGGGSVSIIPPGVVVQATKAVPVAFYNSIRPSGRKVAATPSPGVVRRVESREMEQQRGDASGDLTRTFKAIRAWISDEHGQRRSPLVYGELCRLHVQAGDLSGVNLALDPNVKIPRADIPLEGLTTEWLLTARSLDILDADSNTELHPRDVGGERVWVAQFRLHLPHEGDSEQRQFTIRALQTGPPRCDVSVFILDKGPFPRLYRTFTIRLHAVEKVEGEVASV